MAPILCQHHHSIQSSAILRQIALSYRNSVGIVRPAQVQLPKATFFSLIERKPIVFHQHRVVPFDCKTFYDVVMDIDSYAEFLPFCKSSKVLARNPHPHHSASSSLTSPSSLRATLTIGFQMFTESYTSLVQYQQDREIKIQSIDTQLFESLNSQWRFRPSSRGLSRGHLLHSPATKQQSQSCEVDFTIDFTVRNILHETAVQVIFSDVANQQINAFIERCHYLRRKNQPSLTNNNTSLR